MPRTKATTAEHTSTATPLPAAAATAVPPADVEVLTLAEAAAYLRVPEDEVRRSAREQGLPGRVIGAEWRFLKSALQDWLRTPPLQGGKEALLAMAGAFKDDPYLEGIVQEAYRRRGRPITENAK